MKDIFFKVGEVFVLSGVEVIFLGGMDLNVILDVEIVLFLIVDCVSIYIERIVEDI